MDWLRDETAGLYQDRLRSLGIDPWAARDAYIQVILDRSEEMGHRLELVVRFRLEGMMEQFAANFAEPGLLEQIRTILKLLGRMNTEVNYWQIQNCYHRMAQTVTQDFSAGARAGDREALRWLEGFRDLGIELSFNIESLFKKFGLEIPGEEPVPG